MLKVLSNGKFKSIGHRAVTKKLLPRLSLGMLYTPSEDAVIGPIEDLINEEHFPKYRNYIFKEYMEEFYWQEGKRRRVPIYGYY
nr:protein dmr6-like oxygenase 2 [Quercus suber]